MPSILLTGVIGPHRNIHFDLSGDRLTRDQDIFTAKSHFHYVVLHFLAQNLSSPCVVLEHPSLEDFEEELGKGYDFVGINFTLVNIVKTMQMCDAVRRVAPQTKIVLGGYGTSCFTTIFKGNDEIRKLADHICHGEGVRFLRELLGEPVDAPIHQPVGPRGASGMPVAGSAPARIGRVRDLRTRLPQPVRVLLHLPLLRRRVHRDRQGGAALRGDEAALAAAAREPGQRRRLRREPLQGQGEGHEARPADPRGRGVRARARSATSASEPSRICPATTWWRIWC